MELDRLQFSIKQTIKHQQSILNTLAATPHSDLGAQDTIGGVLRNGQLGWTALGSHIAVVCLKTGNRVSCYNFESLPQCGTTITCVCEVDIPGSNACILAIGLQSAKHSGKLCLFAVQGSRKLRTIEIVDKVTSCCFIRASAVQKNDLLQFDGCLAIGTDIGQIILIDLDLNQCKEVLYGNCKANNEANCVLALASKGSHEIRREQKSSKNSDMNFGIRLDVLSDASPIISILSLPPLRSMAIGMGDGRLMLYSLGNMEAYHLAHPPEPNSPLVKMAYIEPADDPRACIYVWASHANAKMSIAVMHSIMFTSKVLTNDNVYVYKNFQVCKSVLTMPIYVPESFPISCQSVSKSNTDDDNVLRLCLLVWTARASSYVCVFDLNQWYKEQMPELCDMRQHPTYLAVFQLKNTVPLDVWMDQRTVTTFSSIQRPEEHFYPSSLSFDCAFLSSIDCKFMHWTGLQNQILDQLSASGPNAILDPNRGFAEVRCASLIPQFTDYNFNTNLSIQMKQEFLLSIALEYNCNGLLRDCARAWADGSHMGQEPSEGLTLSTLTNWIWKRASLIKEHCNSLCISLFDHSGTTMGLREQKVLLNCSRQLKTLSELLTMILTSCRQFIPNSVLDTLKSQRNSICMAFEYQEVLQWLLNMGLLPEGAPNPYLFEKNNAVPYPYRVLRNYYTNQRQKFKDINRDLLTSRRSCKILYIDSFIETECNPSILRSEWRKGNGDGLYPPPSLQSMLRTLLVPGVSIENKYMLFVYLFLDLSIALKDDVFVGVVEKLIKFPAVFRLNPALIKTTQAFWNLDHGQFQIAIEDLTSPLTRDHQLQTWQHELLIESLLLQDVPQLALRVLRAPGPAIAPVLAIRTLLANDLVSEAFLLQRSKADEGLLLEFFRSCHEHKKWHLVLDLALTGAEEQCLGEFLRTSDSSMGENLHFLYLVQRSKYIEAIAFIADLQQNPRQHSHRSDIETPNTILSAYKLTMTPATCQMSDIYYSLRDNIDKKLKNEEIIPNPLSSKLLQRKLDLTGGVYHRSVLSTEQTTPSMAMFHQNKPQYHLDLNTVPFLRNPQYLMLGRQQQHVHNTGISYPVTFSQKQKRSNRDATISLISDGEDEDAVLEGQRKKRRIIGPEHPRPLTVLTVFKDKPSVSMIRSNDSLTQATQTQKSAEIPNTVLTTPVVLSSRKTLATVSPERVTTPHSILKVKIAHASSAMPTSRQSVSPCSVHERGRSVDLDEKSIRFSLPPQRLATTIDEEEENETNVTERSVETFNADQASASGDEFFSPNASIDKTESEVLAHRLSDGPKPRKRLRSGSSSSGGNTTIEQPKTSSVPVEEMPVRRSLRSRSKTPDVELIKVTPSIRSARSRSKTPEVELSSKLNAVVNSSTPLRRKPLSRLVLEANANKVNNQTVGEQCVTESVIPEEMELSIVASELAEQSSLCNSSDDNIGLPRPSYLADDTSQFLKRWGVGVANTSDSSDFSVDSGSKLCNRLSDSDASFVLNLQEAENVRQPIVRIIPVQHVEGEQIDVDDYPKAVVAQKSPEFEIMVENVVDNITEVAVDNNEVHSSTSNSSSESTDDEVANELLSSSSSELDEDDIIVLDSSSEEEPAKKQPIAENFNSWESDDYKEDSMEDLQMQEDDDNEQIDDESDDLETDEEEWTVDSSCEEIEEADDADCIEMEAVVAVNEVFTVESDEAIVDDVQLGENVDDDIYSDLAATDLTDQVYGEMGEYDEDDCSEQSEADNELNEALIWESQQTEITSATALTTTLSANDTFNEAIIVSESMQGEFSNLSETVDPKQTVETTQDVVNTLFANESENILNKRYEDINVTDMDASSSKFTPDLSIEIKSNEIEPATSILPVEADNALDEVKNLPPQEMVKPTSEVSIVEPITASDQQSVEMDVVVEADPIPSTIIAELDSNSSKIVYEAMNLQPLNEIVKPTSEVSIVEPITTTYQQSVEMDVAVVEVPFVEIEIDSNSSMVAASDKDPIAALDSILSSIQTDKEVLIVAVDSNSSKTVDEIMTLQPLNENVITTSEISLVEPITITDQQPREMDLVVEVPIVEAYPIQPTITAEIDSDSSIVETSAEVPFAEVELMPTTIETDREVPIAEIDSISSKIVANEEVPISTAVPLPSTKETNENILIIEDTERLPFTEADAITSTTTIADPVIEIQPHDMEFNKEVAEIPETVVKCVEETVNVENEPIEQQETAIPKQSIVSEEVSVESEKAVDVEMLLTITTPSSENEKHESTPIKQVEHPEHNESSKSSGSGHNLRITRARSNSADIKQLDSSATSQRRNLRGKSIEHNSAIIDSPKLKRKVRGQSEPRELELTPKRLLRKSDASTSKVEEPTELPKRRGRKPKSADKVDMDDNVSVASASSVGSNRTTRSTRSNANKIVLNDDDDGAKSIISIRSGKSTRPRGKEPKTSLPIISEEASSSQQSTEYSDSRRLTRHQISVMNTINKNMEVYNLKASRGLSTTNTEEYAMEDDTSEDDSIITTSSRSNVSRKSTRLNLRSQQKNDGNSEKGSIEKTSPNLEAIAEVDDNEVESPTTKRRRTTKQRPRRAVRKLM